MNIDIYNKLFYINVFNNINNINFNKKINIVFINGGLRGLYYCGCCYFINKYIDHKNIISITGTSAGSLAAVILACNVDIYKCRYSYDILNKEYKKNNSIINSLKKICKFILPNNAYKICNEKNVSIIVSKMTMTGIKRIVFNNFISNKHLIKCILASSYIPYIYSSGYKIFQNINNDYYIDGGFSEDLSYYLSCKNFDNCYNKVIFDPHMFYKFKHMLYPIDDDIDKLILLGLYDSYKFFSTNKNLENIYYYDINKHNNNNYKKNLNNILMYIILFYIINEILFMFNIKINNTIYKIYKIQKIIINLIILLILLYLLFIYKYKIIF